jgi:beta-glucanase (GH16 family)
MKKLLLALIAALAATLFACDAAVASTTTTTTTPTTTTTTTTLPETTTTATPSTTTSRPCKAKGFEYDPDALSYDLIWFDEFNSTTSTVPSILKWTYQTGGGGWGNDELQYYTNGQNSSVGDGLLTISARKETVETNEYSSSRMNSAQSWTYVKIQVRAKLPQGAGTWPAIWMMPQHSAYGNWPNSGEIDIMEHVGTAMNRVHFSVHTERFNHKIGTQKTFVTTVSSVASEFHVYEVEWLPDKIHFLVDGIRKWTYQPTDYVSCPTEEEWPFDKPFYLLLNVAIGGWGGTPYAGFAEETMEIDYVRVYQATQLRGIR